MTNDTVEEQHVPECRILLGIEVGVYQKFGSLVEGGRVRAAHEVFRHPPTALNVVTTRGLLCPEAGWPRPP